MDGVDRFLDGQKNRCPEYHAADSRNQKTIKR